MLNHFPKQIFTMRRVQWTPVWPVLDLSRRASIGAFLGLIWLVDFFIISHIFLFLCVPCKFWMDARHFGFYFIGYRVFLYSFLYCSWALLRGSVKWLGTGGSRLASPWGSASWELHLMSWVRIVFPSGWWRYSPIPESSRGNLSSLQVAISAALGWACAHPPGTWPGSPICESGTRGPVYTCPSQGLLSCMARGPLSEKCYFIYFVFCL